MESGRILGAEPVGPGAEMGGEGLGEDGGEQSLGSWAVVGKEWANPGGGVGLEKGGA